MFIGDDRNQLRKTFVTAWEKQQKRQPMEPLEQIIAEIISMHPEYHAMLESPEVLQQEFTAAEGNTNPFLHMGMHIAIREQLITDRPTGIMGLYTRSLNRLQDAHAVEHCMMECLGESLWQAQQSGELPDEARYLECLRKQLGD
jgi:hypothetical protein